jgi:hypothetical protein
MRPGLGVFIIVGILTAFLAPIAFGALLLMYAATSGEPMARALPEVVMIVTAGGLIAAAPTLLIGTPTAVLLEQSGMTGRIDYILGGILGGMIGGITLVLAFGIPDQQKEREEALTFVFFAMGYGPLAALVFHTLLREATPPA